METNNQYKSKIVIVSNALSGGGAEKSMMALHQSFLKNGIRSNLIALNQSSVLQPTPFVTTLNRKWKSGSIFTFRNFLNFRDLLESIDPELLIINCELPELYGAMLRSRRKIICVEHTSRPWNRKKFLGFAVRSVLKFKKAKWVTVIKGQQKIWLAGKAFAYIPNPYINQSTKNRKTSDGTSLTFIGGLKENKRPDWVIKAGLNLNLNVQVIGDGALRASLEKEYDKHSSQIKFFGFNPNPWDLVSSESLVIVPSDYEGDGMVVVEAVLSGNPILLRDNPDLRRFGFDEKHYFYDLGELISIVKKNTESKFKKLVVSQSKTQELKFTRTLPLITKKWIDIIDN